MNIFIFADCGKQTITTKGMKAEIRCVEKNAFRTVVEICHEMMIPSGMGEELQRQRGIYIDHIRVWQTVRRNWFRWK